MVALQRAKQGRRATVEVDVQVAIGGHRLCYGEQNGARADARGHAAALARPVAACLHRSATRHALGLAWHGMRLPQRPFSTGIRPEAAQRPTRRMCQAVGEKGPFAMWASAPPGDLRRYGAPSLLNLKAAACRPVANGWAHTRAYRISQISGKSGRVAAVGDCAMPCHRCRAWTVGQSMLGQVYLGGSELSQTN